MDIREELTTSLGSIRREVAPHLRSTQKRILIEHHLRLEHATIAATRTPAGDNDTANGIHSPQNVPPVEQEQRFVQMPHCAGSTSSSTDSEESDPDALESSRSQAASPTEREESAIRELPASIAPAPSTRSFSRADAESLRPERDTSEQDGDRMRRQFLLRRFFRAARPPASRMQAQASGAGTGSGAPMFTVGGTGFGSAPITEAQGGTGAGERRARRLYDGGEVEGEEEIGFSLGVHFERRASLLRRILHAMRESARERSSEPEVSTSPPSPGSQELLHSARLPLSTVPFCSGRSQRSISPPSPAGAVEMIPIHPRQEQQARQSFQAIFQALMELLPPGDGGIQAAIARSGRECQDHIRALQRGIEVTRLIHPTRETGSVVYHGRRSRLTLCRNATLKGIPDLVLENLHSSNLINSPPEHAAAITTFSSIGGWSEKRGGEGGRCEVTLGPGIGVRNMEDTTSNEVSSRPNTPRYENAPDIRLAVSNIAQIRCLTSDSGDHFQFVIVANAQPSDLSNNIQSCTSGTRQSVLAHCQDGGSAPCESERTQEVQGEGTETDQGTALKWGRDVGREGRGDSGECGRKGGYGVREGQRQETWPFGVLSVDSDDILRAVVLGVASVKSAFNSRQRTCSPYGLTGGIVVPNDDYDNNQTAAAAALPWQGARVCITALAQTRGLVKALRAVEEELQRACFEHGDKISAYGALSGLLICTDSCTDA